MAAAENQKKEPPKEEKIYSAPPKSETEETKESASRWTPPPPPEIKSIPVEKEVEVPLPPPPTIVTTRESSSFIKIPRFVLEKTYGAAVKRLGKTAFGKAIKEGVKKATTWAATKLGIQAAITAAGAATAGTGVGPIIAAAVNIVIEVASKILGKAKLFIKNLLEKPESLLGVGIALGVLGAAFSAPLLIAIGVTVGVVGAAPILVATVPAAIGGFFGAVGAFPATFFGAMSAWATGTVVAVGITIVLGILALVTWFQVMLTSSAFILPKLPQLVSTTPVFGTPVEPRGADPSLHLAERVISILHSCGIDQVTSSNLSDVKECLFKSNLNKQEKDIVYGAIELSAANYTYLQCVGFVRAITAALGRDIGAQASAKLYYSNPPSGYTLYTDMSLADVGDIVIRTSGDDGHIAIVVRKYTIEEQGHTVTIYWIAEANVPLLGAVTIEEIRSLTGILIGFDGFLR